MSRGCSERTLRWETIGAAGMLGMGGLYLLFSFAGPREVLLTLLVDLIDRDYLLYHTYSDPVSSGEEISIRFTALALIVLTVLIYAVRIRLLQNNEVKVFSRHCEVTALPMVVIMPLTVVSLTGRQIQTMRSNRSGRFTIRTTDGRTIRFFASNEQSCVEAINAMMANCYNAGTSGPERPHPRQRPVQPTIQA